MFNNVVGGIKPLVCTICFFTLAMMKPSCANEVNSQATNVSVDTESLLQTANKYLKTDSDRALDAADTVYQYALKHNDHKLQVRALLLLAKISKQNKQHYLVQKYLTETEANLDNIDDISLSIQAYSLLAKVEKELKKYPSSFSYGEKLLALAKVKKDPKQLYLAYRHQGQVHKLMKRYHAALQTFLTAQTYTQEPSSLYKFQALWDIVGVYNSLNDHATRITYIQKAIEVLNTNKFSNKKRDLPKAYIQLAKSQRHLNQYEAAIENGTKAIAAAKVAENPKMVAYSSVLLSRVYRRLGDYDAALAYCHKATEIYQEIGDVNGFVSASNALGLIYKHLEMPNEAILAHQAVLAQPINKMRPKYLGAALRELALHYFNGDKQFEALVMIKQAYEVYKKAKSVKGMASVQKMMGRFYKELGDAEAALASYDKAIEYSRLIEDKWNEAEVIISMSLLKVHQDPVDAEKLALKGLALAESIQAKWVTEQAYTALIEISEKQGKFEAVAKYTELKKQISAEIKAEKV